MSHDDRLLATWKARAVELIGHRLADARAHAEAGRMAAATVRLGELAGGLKRLIGDARVAFLRRVARRQGLDFDPEARRAVRRHPILGRRPADAVSSLNEANRQLQTAKLVGPATAVFDAWEAHHKAFLTAVVASHLSDAQVSIDNVVALLQAGAFGPIDPEETDHAQDAHQALGPEAAQARDSDQSAQAEAGRMGTAGIGAAPEEGLS